MTGLLNDVSCPQCGLECSELVEGYCPDCCEDNQRRLDLHNAEYDHWKSLSDKERSDAIKRACRG